MVGPCFYSLSFNQKRDALQVVADLVRPKRGGDHFVLYDWQTNKKVGSFSEKYGLNLE